MKTNSRDRERVVITAMGAITPVGDTLDQIWSCVRNGKSGVNTLNGINCPVKIGGQLSTAGLERYGDIDRCSALALSAAESALLDLKMRLTPEIRSRLNVFVGSSKGGVGLLERVHTEFLKGGLRKIPDNFIMNLLTSASSDHIAYHFQCGGIRQNIVAACATGIHSIIMSAKFIADRRGKIALAGSAEASLTPLILSAFDKMGVLSKDYQNPKKSMKPYDKNRDGFVVSEGTGVVVLESLSSALERNARIYGEISGWAMLGDAYHLTAMDPEGKTVAAAIHSAIKKAGLCPAEIDYINSHGTATKQNDVIETIAIKEVFGRRASDIHISSTKPVTGHLLGASGSIELIITLLAMKNNFIPPTINLDKPDPECDLNYTPNIGVEKPIRNAITLNYGFGGHIAALVISKYKK